MEIVFRITFQMHVWKVSFDYQFENEMNIEKVLVFVLIPTYEFSCRNLISNANFQIGTKILKSLIFIFHCLFLNKFYRRRKALLNYCL